MQFTGSSGPESHSLKGSYELKQAQANIVIFSPRDPPGMQRPGSQVGIVKLQWTPHFGHFLRNLFSEAFLGCS